MIAFDLQCQSGHVFEAWFRSSNDFAEQQNRGLISCPYCADTRISKAVMAPSISTKGNRASAQPQIAAKAPTSEAASMQEMVSKLAKLQAKVLESSQWVGRDFEKKARAMDAGEIATASIHGEVSKAEAKALIDDGIGVMPLPFPVIPPDKRN